MIYIECDPRILIGKLLKRKRKLVRGARNALAMWSSSVLAQVIARNQSRPGLVMRSGNLIRSLRHRETGTRLGTLKTHLIALRRIAPYARIHEYGTIPEGTLPQIKPKRATFLAVPLRAGPAVDARGIKRYESPLRQTLPESAGIRPITTGPNQRYLKDKMNRLWYKLVDQVSIPPRLGMRDTVERSKKDLIARLRNRFQEILTNG